MRYDVDLLKAVEEGNVPPTVRFFRFKEPTVSFGRLQKLKDIAPLVPPGWASVQRPTGGGIVFHKIDLCLSLSWRRETVPLPSNLHDVYRWIHTVIREALGDHLRMASCADGCNKKAPFATRECFMNPVSYDLLNGKQKVVGGALHCRRNAFLYQGAIQNAPTRNFEESLRVAFERALTTSHV
jgi:lipoate-protein ligase A